MTLDRRRAVLSALVETVTITPTGMRTIPAEKRAVDVDFVDD